ncbi:MAG: B12-binding domain-containing radical SAM protein [Myxococcota bacterium]|nr:B12-binding domain-containing radical SAM protein [Myxococcota bacterium]
MANKRIKLITIPWDLEVPTLSLASLAAVTPPQIDVAIVDALRERIVWDEPVDLVGLSASTPAINRAYTIADRFREMGVKVVIGGHHSTAMPDEALQHCDAVICGEGETSWMRLCDELLTNPSKIGGVYHDPAPDLGTLPQPRVDLMKIERYGSFFYPLIASRGCPESCTFCFSKRMTRGFRTYPISHILEQVRRRPSFINAGYFVDDNLCADLDFARELFKELKKLKFPFGIQARASFGESMDDLKLAREAGCTLMSSGYESVNQASLKGTGKRTIATDYKQLISNINAAGIIASGNWMFGFDWDTPAAFAETIEFIDSTDLGHCSFTSEIPFPGTATFKRYEREGRILTYDYDRYSGKDEVVFKPKGMTAEELAGGIRWITHQFYSTRRATRRLKKAMSAGTLGGVAPKGLRGPALAWLNYSQAAWWRVQLMPRVMKVRKKLMPLHLLKHPTDLLKGTNFWGTNHRQAVPSPEKGAEVFETKSPFLFEQGLKPSRTRPLKVAPGVVTELPTALEAEGPVSKADTVPHPAVP